MTVEVTTAQPAEVEADVLAMAAGGLLPRQLDPRFEGRLARSATAADPVTIVQVGRELRAQRGALVDIEELDPEGLRTAAARAVRAHRGGGTIAWALDESLPYALYRQVQAGVEGAGLGGYRADRWKSDAPPPVPERFLVCGATDEHHEVAARAELMARWTNVARELV